MTTKIEGGRNFFRHIIFMMILIGSVHNIAAQKPKIYFDHLTTKDDLSQNSVLCIYQDSNGFMWFGTQAGLDSYDGISFYHYSNATNNETTIKAGFVNTLFEDKQNRLLWIGTGFGISSLDLKDRKTIRQYRLPTKENVNNIVSIKGNQKGGLWIATTTTVYQFRNNQFVPATIARGCDFNSTNTITDFSIDTITGMGVIATTNGAFKFNSGDNEFISRIKLSGLKGGSFIRKILLLNNELVVGTENGGVYRMKSSKQNANSIRDSFYVKDECKYIPDENMGISVSIKDCSSILRDKKGSLWIGSRRSGVILITDNNTGQNFIRDFETDKSLASSYILSLCESRDSTIWVGTDGGGVNKYSAGRLNFYKYFTSNFKNAEFTSNNDVWSITQLNKHTVLLGTDGNGVVGFSLDAKLPVTYMRDRQTTSANVVRALAKMDSVLLVGTSGGLFSVPLSGLSDYRKYEINRDSISAFLVTRTGVWEGTSKKGIMLLDPVSLQPVKSFSFNEISGRINSIIATNHSNEVAVGTSGGIYIIRQQGNQFDIKTTLLPGYFITSLVLRHDSLWVGTKGEGLLCIDINSGKEYLRFTKSNGLIDNMIYGLLDDGNGKLWMSTNKGICVYFIAAQTFNQYTRQYGLQHDEFNIGSYNYDGSVDNPGMFFGGVNGFNVFDPLNLSLRHTQSEIALIAYKNPDDPANSQVIAGSATDSSTVFEVDPKAAYTRLDVRIFDYTDPANNKYKYQLNGRGWSTEKPVNESILIPRSSLKLLRPRLLEIYVRTSNGEWQKIQTIRVKLPVDLFAEYKYSRPALVFAAGLIVFIIIIVSYRRTRRLKKAKKESDQKEKKLTEINGQLQLNMALLAQEKKKHEEISVNLSMQNNELRALQSLLDEISGCSKTEELIELALKHLTWLLKFDYAIFYEVDHLNDMVIFHKREWKNKEIPDPLLRNDIKRSFSLTSNEALAVAARKDKIIEAHGRTIINDQDAELNTEMFDAFDHKGLTRVWIPVKPRQISQQEGISEFRTIGVLEIGSHKSKLSSFEESQTTKLSIYANSLALHYQLITEREIEANAREILIAIEKEAENKPGIYLQKILDKVCSEIKSDYGGIALLSLSKSSVSKDDIKVRFPSDARSINPNPGHLPFTYKSIESEDVVIANNLSSKVDGKMFDYSSISIPLKYGKKIIGSAEIVGNRSDFYNEKNIFFLRKIFETVGEEYVNMKFHEAVKDLVSPDNIFTEPNKNISPVMRTIQRYFLCEYVSVWLRNYPEIKTDQIEFAQWVGSDGIRTGCKNYGGKNKVLNDQIPEFEVIDLDTPEPDNHNGPFWKFGKENGMICFIHIPLRVDKHKYGFINVYSKRKIDKRLPELDRQFVELIANKAAISYVTSKMIFDFSDITQSLVAKQQENILQKITDSAREVLQSDPVILFRYKKDTGLLNNEIIYSGFLYDEKKLKEDGKSDFIEKIVAGDRDQFFTEEKRLPDSYALTVVENDVETESFWRRERIEALAVIILKHEGNPIGIMCFNYRKKQEFPLYVKELFSAFSSLASNAINNIDNVATIKEQRKRLEEYAIKIEGEKRTIEDEKGSMEIQIKELIPSVNAASLTEIIRAVNHDIRNHLTDISQHLVTLQEDANIKSGDQKEHLLSIISIIKADIDNSNNLISLFQPNSFVVTYEDLPPIIEKVKTLFTNRLRKDNTYIDLKINILNNEIPTIRCCKAEIGMIVYNLVTNARYAILQRWRKNGAKPKTGLIGTITVELDYTDNETPYFIAVEDDGIGIDNDKLNVIYEPGYSTRNEEGNKGLGIGLHFVKSTLMTLYLGKITCDSYANKYTRFELKFKQHIK